MKMSFACAFLSVYGISYAQGTEIPFVKADLKDLKIEQGAKYYAGHYIVQSATVLIPRDSLSHEALLFLAKQSLVLSDYETLSALDTTRRDLVVKIKGLESVQDPQGLVQRTQYQEQLAKKEKELSDLLDRAFRKFVTKPLIAPHYLTEGRSPYSKERNDQKLLTAERLVTEFQRYVVVLKRTNAYESSPRFALVPDTVDGGSSVQLLRRSDFEVSSPSQEKRRWTRFYDVAVPQAIGYDDTSKKLIVLVSPDSFRHKKAQRDENFVVALRGDGAPSSEGVPATAPYSLQANGSKAGVDGNGRTAAPVFQVPKEFTVESLDSFAVENVGQKTGQELLGKKKTEYYLDPSDGQVKTREVDPKKDLQGFDYDLLKPNLFPDLIFPVFGERQMPYTEFQVAGRLSTSALDKKALETISFRTLSNADNALQQTALRGFTIYGNERFDLVELVTDLGLRRNYAIPFGATDKQSPRRFPARDAITPVSDVPLDLTIQGTVQLGGFVRFNESVFQGDVDSRYIARLRLGVETAKIPIRGLPLKFQLTGAVYINPVAKYAGGQDARTFEEVARISLLVPAGKQDLRISYVGGANPATAFKRTPYTLEFSIDLTK